jgi:hypothetical protein
LVAEKRPDKMSLAERAKRNTAANANGDPNYVRKLGDQVTKLTVEAIKVFKPEVLAGPAAKPAAKPVAKGAEDIAKKARDIKVGLQGRGFSGQLTDLTNLLKSNPPRSMKLTPYIDELGPPPALAGDKSVTEGAAEEGDANGAAVTGRSDP